MLLARALQLAGASPLAAAAPRVRGLLALLVLAAAADGWVCFLPPAGAREACGGGTRGGGGASGDGSMEASATQIVAVPRPARTRAST